MTLTETRRNGTGASMPILTVDVDLEDIGYPGWHVIMRKNPRSSVYTQLTTFNDPGPADPDDVEALAEQRRKIQEEQKRWWIAFGQIVIEWNLTDETGKALPQPCEVEQEKDLDLPIKLLQFVLDRYFEAVRTAAAVPKALSDNSAPISSTSEGQPRNE